MKKKASPKKAEKPKPELHQIAPSLDVRAHPEKVVSTPPLEKQKSPVIRFKKTTYRNPNRLQAETGHKGFDSTADYIGTGNVISNIQSSSFIRPFTETECNGFTSKEGELQAFDLKPFVATRIPQHVLNKVKELTQTEAVILYRFHHHHSGGKTVHGYVITRAGSHELLTTFVTGPTRKSEQVIEWCLQYITPQPESAAA